MDIRETIIDSPNDGVFRYHRSALRSQEILDLEYPRIFDLAWLYLGHESEVPNVGDFRRRTVARRPLFFIRGADGEIRCFYNTCTHRGARVCRQDAGNATSFQCFYHAWTFDPTGTLVGVPDVEAFGRGFDRERFRLGSPRHESYRGFHFVCFSRETEPLVDYLGGGAEFIDLVADQSVRGLRVLPGTNLYAAQTNWKLFMENSLDTYHFRPTHVTYTQFLASQVEDDWPDQPTGPDYGYSLGNGHAGLETPTSTGRPVAVWHPSMGESARPEIERVRRELAEWHGEERATRIAERTRAAVIFPNLIILDVMTPLIRVVWPKAPDYCEVTAWTLGAVGESATMERARLQNVSLFVGGGGFGTPDDIEALEACQEGSAATEVEWSDISRGIGKFPHATSELQLRTFWREWHARLLGQTHADHSVEPAPHEYAASL